MTEPAEEQPDPRTIPRLSSFLPRMERAWPGTPDAGAPWDDNTFSRDASAAMPCDKRGMAATASEGTARKPVCVNAAARSPRANSGNIK